MYFVTYLVSVRLSPRPSRSIHFGDISETKARSTWPKKYWPRQNVICILPISCDIIDENFDGVRYCSAFHNVFIFWWILVTIQYFYKSPNFSEAKPLKTQAQPLLETQHSSFFLSPKESFSLYTYPTCSMWSTVTSNEGEWKSAQTYSCICPQGLKNFWQNINYALVMHFLKSFAQMASTVKILVLFSFCLMSHHFENCPGEGTSCTLVASTFKIHSLRNHNRLLECQTMFCETKMNFYQLKTLLQNPVVWQAFTNNPLGNLKLQMCILCCDLFAFSLEQLIIPLIKVLRDVSFFRTKRFLQHFHKGSHSGVIVTLQRFQFPQRAFQSIAFGRVLFISNKWVTLG